MIVHIFLMCLVTITAVPLNQTETSTHLSHDEMVTPFPSRRILGGRPVGETRPYMVYLRAAEGADAKLLHTNWNCGGVIIDPRFILTSAACIEDAKHFYVVSGTHKWVPAGDKSNECINYGAKRAVWKCVPKDMPRQLRNECDRDVFLIQVPTANLNGIILKAYYYDGDDFDNIRWMVGDIAVVKVEDDFNFERRVRGCDFIPKKVMYNNRSEDMEKGGTQGSMAGWGAMDKFGDVIGKPAKNSPDLLEADAILMSKKACMKRWDSRYHFVIQDHMVCTRDITDEATLNAACADEVNCKELVYSDEDDDDVRRRMILNPSKMVVHTSAHIDGRRATHHRHRVASGGFCENDHGGPLIVGQGKSSVVIGIMSACLAKDITQKCYGPFLYTSVFKYRNLISCAIDKDNGPQCKKLLRSSKTPMFETTFDWSDHPEGPSKTNHKKRGKVIAPHTMKPALIPRAGLVITDKPQGLEAVFSRI